MSDTQVKAVLFDLDGTLLDTVKDIGTGANLALCRCGCPEYPLEDYRGFVGHGIKNLFRKIVPASAGEEVYQKALDFYLSYYPDHCMDHTEEFPGIRELLHKLQAAGYRLGVITNKTQETAQKIMDHYFPEVDFAFVWGRSGDRPLKPDPAAGILACAELGVKPEEVLFFGDGDTDMAFAVNSGFWPVACSWGYRSREELTAAGARQIVDTTAELEHILHL